MRNNSLERMNELIKKVQSRLLTSHTIINRIEQPYFWAKTDIPPTLSEFKRLITIYRKKCSDFIAENAALLSPMLPTMAGCNDLSKTGFFHSIVLHNLVARYGIGECGECAVQIAIELTKAGFRDLAFVGMHFTAANTGMEQYHQLIITNLPQAPNAASNQQPTFTDFIKLLPSKAIIVDAFLGLSFTPSTVPEVLTNYINAYGGKAFINEFRHFFNCSERFFDRYLMVANLAKMTLDKKQTLPNLGRFASAERWRTLTLPITSESAKNYLNQLGKLLGSDSYRNIVTLSKDSKTVSFPSFWVKQLETNAIQELAENLEIEAKEFLL